MGSVNVVLSLRQRYEQGDSLVLCRRIPWRIAIRSTFLAPLQQNIEDGIAGRRRDERNSSAPAVTRTVDGV